MPKRELQHPTLGGAPGFSRAIEVSGGRTVYFAGQAPNDVGIPTVGIGDMGAQADACLKKLEALVGVAGGTMADFVMLNIYVTDMDRMGEVRQVLDRYLTERPLPAISGFEVAKLANPDWLVEVDGVAFLADA